MKTPILILCVAAITFSCVKSSDPVAKISGNTGSWSYKGTSFTGNVSMWYGPIVESVAEKPHASALQANFSSSSPSAGNYTIVELGSVSNSNQVAISVVDATLAAPEYLSPADNPGTVTVSKSGSTITVTIKDAKLKGLTTGAVADSIVVSGTIVK